MLEERQRIARELHDVVAHHMSVIAIQAEAAPYKTADPPKELVESFADIRASTLSGLGELRRVLGVLRSEAPGTAPTPGLHDLGGLLESARSGGVTVTREITGAPRPLQEGVDLSAYRIVQEALSNAMRHAPGSTVQVRLHFGEAALIIEVRNSDGVAGARAGTSARIGSSRLRRTTPIWRMPRDHPRGGCRRPGDGAVRLFRAAQRPARYRGHRRGRERPRGGDARGGIAS